jgi:transposase
MPKLTSLQVQQKLQEGRNYKYLYTALKVRFDEVKAENTELRAVVAAQEARLNTQAIQIAELQTMVFGKKKQPPTGTVVPVLPAPVVLPRTKTSYRRPIPPATAITSEVVVPLPETCICGSNFDPERTTTHNRYQEDIPLPELTPDYQPHLVTKYVIERGICLACGKVTSSKDLGGQAVTLGPNVRLLMTHLVTVIGMSYAQVANLLLSLYGLTVSDGEIANSLQKQHESWLPAYNQLKADIRAAPVVHGDETPWPIQALQGAGYAWNICDASSPKVCFALEQSRGATYAQSLLGQNTDQPFAGVRITDDYGAYRNQDLPGIQQLCWVHLYRVIRDLRYNANLPPEQLPYVAQWHEQFAAIYQDLRQYLDEPYDEVVRATQATELWQRTKVLAQQPTPRTGEPDKLYRLKAQLLRACQDRLFVCLPKDTPCDNNRAERDLRQLVLKRKRSFGSKTGKGATALATVLSICTTTWRASPTGYFQQLALLG